MQIISERVNRIVLEFVQDLDNGLDDISPLVLSLQKFKKIINKPGFKNEFSKKERDLWNQIFNDILENPQKPEGISGIMSSMTST